MSKEPENNARLDALARAWHTEAQAGEHISERVRSIVFTPSPSRLFPRLSAAFAAVVMIAVAGGIGTTLWRPLPVLAAVQKAMGQVKTARWRHDTVTRAVRSGKILRQHHGTTTIDMNRLSARVEDGPDEIYIRVGRQGYWIRGGNRVTDDRTVSEAEVMSDLRRRLFPEDRIRDRATDWQVRNETWGGKPVRHFILTNPPGAPVASTGDAVDEFWADARTNRLLRTVYSVRRWEDKVEVEDTFTTYDYAYDIPLSKDVFEH
jgi:hypothetical protein